jgi:hypothetical protein
MQLEAVKIPQDTKTLVELTLWIGLNRYQQDVSACAPLFLYEIAGYHRSAQATPRLTYGLHFAYPDYCPPDVCGLSPLLSLYMLLFFHRLGIKKSKAIRVTGLGCL